MISSSSLTEINKHRWEKEPANIATETDMINIINVIIKYNIPHEKPTNTSS